MIARVFELERLHAQLQLWNAEMKHLGAKLDDSPDEAGRPGHAALRAELETLRQLWAEAALALYRLESADDAEWRILQERAELDLRRLGAAFEQSRAHFGE
jgi:hypothetical protein